MCNFYTCINTIGLTSDGTINVTCCHWSSLKINCYFWWTTENLLSKTQPLLSTPFFSEQRQRLEPCVLYFHILYLRPYPEFSRIAREVWPRQDQLRLCYRSEGVEKQKGHILDQPAVLSTGQQKALGTGPAVLQPTPSKQSHTLPILTPLPPIYSNESMIEASKIRATSTSRCSKWQHHQQFVVFVSD